MPQYSVANTSGIGKPCIVFDATGEEITFVVWCDTETGEVERMKRDGDNFVANHKGNAVERFKENRPAPLRVEWIETVQKEVAQQD